MDDSSLPGLPAGLKQQMTRYKAPPGLERRVRHMLAREASGPGWLERWRLRIVRLAPLGASFACGALVALAVATWQGGARNEERLEQQVVTAHVRSLQAEHLMDVASTDQHTVKPWFTGKLDFAPPVFDLSAQGFPLAGGRLDYVHDRTAAALVYRRRGHVINLFVLPAGEPPTNVVQAAPRHGFQVLAWRHKGMEFWAVSDVSREEMEKFVAALKAADG